MANTVLIQGALTEVSNDNPHLLGNKFDHKGKDYVFVKNDLSTALVVKEPCYFANPDLKRVSGTRAKSLMAGVPVTAIPASGASTGAFGYVQCAGICAGVTVAGTAAVVGIGTILIGTAAAFLVQTLAGTAPKEVTYAVAITANAASSGSTTEGTATVKVGLSLV